MSTNKTPISHAADEPPKTPDSAETRRPKGGSHARKRKLRLDRIAVIIVPLLLIIVLIGTLCLHSCKENGGLNNSAKVPMATPETSADAKSEEDSSQKEDAKSTKPEDSEPDAVQTTTEASTAESTKITLSADGVKKGNLILINQDHGYTFPDGDPDLVGVHQNSNDSYSVSDMDVQLDQETLEHLNDMMAAFEEETGNRNLQVFSGYRTKEDQQERYDNGSSGFRGGYTDYHSGRTFNIKINFGDGTSDYYNATKYPEYSWISEHAAEYGFIVRFPKEKDSYTGEEGRSYTFRYVGTPHAQYMQEHNLCLEEYLELVQAHTAEDPLEIKTADDTYDVFYVSVGGTNDVSVTIPSSDYTASGDNMSGYVVTCQMTKTDDGESSSDSSKSDSSKAASDSDSEESSSSDTDE